MSITQLETHVRLKRGSRWQNGNHLSAQRRQVKLQEGRAEQRESFRAELGEGPSLEDKKPEEKNKMLHKPGRCRVTGDSGGGNFKEVLSGGKCCSKTEEKQHNPRVAGDLQESSGGGESRFQIPKKRRRSD